MRWAVKRLGVLEYECTRKGDDYKSESESEEALEVEDSPSEPAEPVSVPELAEKQPALPAPSASDGVDVVIESVGSAPTASAQPQGEEELDADHSAGLAKRCKSDESEAAPPLEDATTYYVSVGMNHDVVYVDEEGSEHFVRRYVRNCKGVLSWWSVDSTRVGTIYWSTYRDEDEMHWHVPRNNVRTDVVCAVMNWIQNHMCHMYYCHFNTEKYDCERHLASGDQSDDDE